MTHPLSSAIDRRRQESAALACIAQYIPPGPCLRGGADKLRCLPPWDFEIWTPPARTPLRAGDKILLERTQVLSLLGRSLVSTVTELAGGVNPFEIDLLEGLAAGVGEH